MNFTPSSLFALIVAASFAAGLNVYATVATLGLLSRLNWVTLPHGLAGLSHTLVIVVALALFSVEFFADKIPVFDMFWNAAHTFIRVPVAALLAYKASEPLPPEMRLLATAAGALISGLVHTSKTATRALVTPSPEPVSNIALSTTEDAGAIGLSWLAAHHPYAASALAGTLLVGMVFSLGWIVRRLKRAWAGRPQWLRPGTEVARR